MIHDLPTPDIEKQAEHLFWNKLGGIVTSAATPVDESMDNVRANVRRGLPWFHHTSILKDDNARPNVPVALVGGGPSIKETFVELIDFSTIMICGSSHDWVQEHSPRVPKYCVVCDPDPIAANYLKNPNKDTRYFIASQCHPAVFDALTGHDVHMWHSWPVGPADESVKQFLNEHTPGWIAVGGGCTVGLRAISMVLMMGFSDLHFFGFDSCLAISDDHHAYPFIDPEKESLGDIYEVRMGMESAGGPKERVYRLAGYHLAQAEHYKQTLMAFGHAFKPTFHGDGLLTDLQAMINAEARRLAEEQAT